MTKVYLNTIATAVPPHDIHDAFTGYALQRLNDRDRKMFGQLIKRSQIQHRYSFLRPSADVMQLDADGFYLPGNFPDTKTRMEFYKKHAFGLAQQALDKLNLRSVRADITHLIVTTCTGFYAPGIDLQIIDHYGLNPTVERTMIGFMGCQAAINALKLAYHIVRSNAKARVIVLNLELCTLHMQETNDLEKMLSFLIFADGCAASLVSAESVGIELQRFHSTVLPGSREQITWHIGEQGFDMVLARAVPDTLVKGLSARLPEMLNGHSVKDCMHWAVHPGGRSILDAVRTSLELPEPALAPSRYILEQFGNMSSPTIMFVLKEMLARKPEAGAGCALAFGPGITAESMFFKV